MGTRPFGIAIVKWNGMEWSGTLRCGVESEVVEWRMEWKLEWDLGSGVESRADTEVESGCMEGAVECGQGIVESGVETQVRRGVEHSGSKVEREVETGASSLECGERSGVAWSRVEKVERESSGEWGQESGELESGHEVGDEQKWSGEWSGEGTGKWTGWDVEWTVWCEVDWTVAWTVDTGARMPCRPIPEVCASCSHAPSLLLCLRLASFRWPQLAPQVCFNMLQSNA